MNLWDNEQQFYFDVVGLPDGTSIPLRVFTMEGLVPLFASVAIRQSGAGSAEVLREHLRVFLQRHPQLLENIHSHQETGDGTHFLYAAVFGERLHNILQRVLDPEQFLSPYGIRAVSRYHHDHPYTFYVGGEQFTVAYWPNVSHDRSVRRQLKLARADLDAGELPADQSLQQFHHYYGDDFKVECPTGSGQYLTLNEMADELSRRLITSSCATRGRRAVFGEQMYFQTDPHWRDYVPFHEYFTATRCGRRRQPSDRLDGDGCGAVAIRWRAAVCRSCAAHGQR